jgi:hypothetical protein
MKKLSPAILVVALLLACGNPPDHTSAGAARPRPRFDSLKSSSYVYPLADGNAYMLAGEGETLSVFYLKKQQAIAVSGVQVASSQNEIYPLADGSAYLVCEGEGVVVFHLEGPKAKRVDEVSSLRESTGAFPPTSAGFAWAVLQSEHTRARKAEREKEEAEREPPDPE